MILVCSYFPGFSMAMILDCIHNLGTLFSVKHWLIILNNHLYEIGPCFIRSTRTPSITTAFPFYGAALPFQYSSSEKGYTSVTSSVTSVGSLGWFDLLGMVFWPLMSSWCAIWLEFTRHGGMEVDGVIGDVIDSFPTVMCQISWCNVFPYLFIFSSITQTSQFKLLLL